jgi:hypothetical protein
MRARYMPWRTLAAVMIVTAGCAQQESENTAPAAPGGAPASRAERMAFTVAMLEYVADHEAECHRLTDRERDILEHLIKAGQQADQRLVRAYRHMLDYDQGCNSQTENGGVQVVKQEAERIRLIYGK